MHPTEALRRGVPAVLGALAGAALAGAYGAPAGALLGVMGAEIFRSQRLKSELAAHLADPGTAPAPLEEPEVGAALLAGLAAVEARRLGVPPETACQAIRENGVVERKLGAWLARATASAYPDGDAVLSFALLSAAFDVRAARGLRPAAAGVFFALLKCVRDDLPSADERDVSARLAALGTRETDVRKARTVFFPDYRDSWDILGIAPDSGKDEIRLAWRRLSRRYHPDSPSGDAERFREAREAYDRLRKG